MKEKLINSNFTKETPDQRLIRLGVTITPSPDEHDMVSVRPSMNMFYYGFKLIEDYQVFSEWLMANQIAFTVPAVSIGARYPYHIGIK